MSKIQKPGEIFAEERAAFEEALARLQAKRNAHKQVVGTQEERLRLRERINELVVRMTEPNTSHTPLSDPDHPLRVEYRMVGRRLSYLERRLPETAHKAHHDFNEATQRNLHITPEIS